MKVIIILPKDLTYHKLYISMYILFCCSCLLFKKHFGYFPFNFSYISRIIWTTITIQFFLICFKFFS
jgi:hypothetical protein